MEGDDDELGNSDCLPRLRAKWPRTYIRLCAYQCNAPLLPYRARVGQGWGFEVIRYQIPHPLGMQNSQIPIVSLPLPQVSAGDLNSKHTALQLHKMKGKDCQCTYKININSTKLSGHSRQKCFLSGLLSTNIAAKKLWLSYNTNADPVVPPIAVIAPNPVFNFVSFFLVGLFTGTAKVCRLCCQFTS